MPLTEDVPLDTTEIQRVLTELQRVAIRLDGRKVPPDTGRRSNPELAEVGRDLLRATDLCAVVGAEFAMLYWSSKGRADPRFSEA